eukprot:7389591-Prymnesium_polylepis.3
MASRTVLVQVRKGCSSAEQSVHLALLDASLRLLPRPDHGAKIAAAAFKLTLSIAKLAATMSLDPNSRTVHSSQVCDPARSH